MKRSLLLLTLAPLTALGLSACEPPPDVRITSPDDFLQLSTRLIFSTTNELPRPPRSITVNNDGEGNLSVTGLSITGAQASSFQLAPGQPTSFSIPSGGSAQVSVQFRPPVRNPVVQHQNATLNISTSDPDQPSIPVALKGLNARDFEGNSEPTPQTIFSVLGYGTTVGGTGTVPLIADPANHRFPIGDEIISPFWVRADTNQPAQLIPVARYIQRCPPDPSPVRWTTKTGGSTPLYTFPAPPFDETTMTCDEYKAADPFGGENQRLLPGFTGTTSFSPSGPFGFQLGGSFTDDGRNNGGVVAECPPPRVHPQSHNYRIYPAEATGGQLANTWLVIVDVKFIPQPDLDCPDYVKNYDYQDQVYLLKNARPEVAAGPLPGTAGTSLDFGSAAGGLNDQDGQGTGFTSVQQNSAGNAYLPANLDLATTNSELRITSTTGTNTNQLNTQQNALQLSFDATRDEFEVRARLEGPFLDINAGNEQEAVFFGPDQNNYFKVEVEHVGGGPVLSAVVENSGALVFVPGAQQVNVPGLGTALTLDLIITGSYGAGTLRASYSINGGAPVALGTAVVPKAIASPCAACLGVSRWFSSRAPAGVLVSHRGGAPLVGTFDSFSVNPA